MDEDEWERYERTEKRLLEPDPQSRTARTRYLIYDDTMDPIREGVIEILPGVTTQATLLSSILMCEKIDPQQAREWKVQLGDLRRTYQGPYQAMEEDLPRVVVKRTKTRRKRRVGD